MERPGVRHRRPRIDKIIGLLWFSSRAKSSFRLRTSITTRIFPPRRTAAFLGSATIPMATATISPSMVTCMVLDLKELKEILEREIMQRMDHRHLNYEVPELAGQIPTCENIARVIWQLLEPKITQGKLHRV